MGAVIVVRMGFSIPFLCKNVLRSKVSKLRNKCDVLFLNPRESSEQKENQASQ